MLQNNLRTVADKNQSSNSSHLGFDSQSCHWYKKLGQQLQQLFSLSADEKKKERNVKNTHHNFPGILKLLFFFQLAVQKAKYFEFTNAIINYKS